MCVTIVPDPRSDRETKLPFFIFRLLNPEP